jgi:hypothetical protein
MEEKLYQYDKDTTFVYIDASKKQEFIYDKKKTRNNIGRSLIIRFITEWIDQQEIDQVNDIKKTKNKDNEFIFLSKEAKERGGSLIFSGGGNCIVKFETQDKATEFIKDYSLKVLKVHSELELYMSFVNVGEFIEEKKKEFPNYEKATDDKRLEPMIHKELEERLRIIKENRKSRFMKKSYGIERIKSNSNYSDKEETNEDTESYSTAIKKHFARHFAESLIKADFNTRHEMKVTKDINSITDMITFKFDDYKKNGTDDTASSSFERKNYMGIVAIDGNKMGDLTRSLKDLYLGYSKDDTIENYRNLSENNYFKSLKLFGNQINRVYCNAIRRAIFSMLLNDKSDSKKAVQDKCLTPIVMAGDDITLVFRSTIAIQVAGKIMQNIEDEIIANDEKISTGTEYSIVKELMQSQKLTKLTSGCGVAIVKPGYPFFEAIQIAEKIQKEAKKEVYAFCDPGVDCESEPELTNHSFLSWEVIKGGKKEEIDYSKYSKKGEKDKIYHIKPLYITGEKIHENFENEPKKKKDDNKTELSKSSIEVNHKVYSFKEFETTLRNLEQIKWDCESIKKEMYSPEGRYEMLFEMSKEDRINKIDGIITEYLHPYKIILEHRLKRGLEIKVDTEDYGTIKNGKLIEKLDEKEAETYLLNDFIEIRKFWTYQ